MGAFPKWNFFNGENYFGVVILICIGGKCVCLCKVLISFSTLTFIFSSWGEYITLAFMHSFIEIEMLDLIFLHRTLRLRDNYVKQ